MFAGCGFPTTETFRSPFVSMIRTRHHQPSLWTGVLAEEVDDLWEPWMRTADRLLDDEQLIERVFEAQARRWLNSRTRGRRQTPAEVVLRLPILKHVRNWSYAVLEREVRANLVYRTFARIGAEKVPDAKTLGRLGQVVGPDVIEDLHRRMVQIAVENGIVAGRRMRVDTTVVETNIHYPTDSGLLGDGTRVLTRVMKKGEQAAGGLVGKVRDRMRTARKKVVAIAIAARQKGAAGEEKRRHIYRGLLSVTPQDRESGQTSDEGSGSVGPPEEEAVRRIPRATGHDGRSGQSGGEADAGTDIRREHEVRREAGKCI
jgi:IS5 family transposase